jgi:hypothetical protein
VVWYIWYFLTWNLQTKHLQYLNDILCIKHTTVKIMILIS